MSGSTEGGTRASPLRWSASLGRLGGAAEILRALPGPKIESVGPFIFMDHVGPAPSPRVSLAPHPHAGVEVVTYVIEGTNEHRDSLGNRGQVTSGGAQWLTAGKGMLHAERIGAPTPDAGIAPQMFHAVQLWTRLPKAREDCQPAYRAVDATEIPVAREPGVSMRLVAGQLFSAVGPVTLAQEALLVHVVLQPGASISLPLSSGLEAAVYTLTGLVQVAGDRNALPRGDGVVVSGDLRVTVSNPSDAASSFLLMGGAPAERPLVRHGSFVYASQANAVEADRRFAAGEMGTLEGVPF